jgi:hypothetical protein
MRNGVTAIRRVAPARRDATPLLHLLPAPRGDRRHGDIAGVDVDELVARLAGEPISFSLSGGSWSAMSLTGEYSAHGDTLDEVLDELLEQLPAS